MGDYWGVGLAEWSALKSDYVLLNTSAFHQFEASCKRTRSYEAVSKLCGYLCGARYSCKSS